MGATATYLVVYSDNGQVVNHDSAGSAAVTVTLPTAVTLSNPAFGFEYENDSAYGDTITPTTWTIKGAASLLVPPYSKASVKVDPASATNWLATVVPTYAAFTNCTGAGKAVTVNATTGVWGCNTISGTVTHEISFGFSSPSALTAQTTCGVVTYSGTITGINWVTDVSGNATIDVTDYAQASYTGTAGSYTDIANGGVTMTGATYYNNTTLTSWTTTFTATAASPKAVCFVLSAPATIHMISGKLTLTGSN
jgi:hypothetical protein